MINNSKQKIIKNMYLHLFFNFIRPYNTLKLMATNPSNKYTPVDDYQITGFIGKGSTSRVYQGYNILTKQEVIIKLFKDIVKQQKILREMKVNQIISYCKYVVPLIDVIRDEGCGVYGLIFSNLQGVPLTQMFGQIKFMEGLKYIKNILRALQYCHSHGVVHRDLKKSNILITKSGAKLFDFGLSYIQNVHLFQTKRFGTKGYYTPQVHFHTPFFTHKIDIWVCGIIMAQILSQRKALMPYTSDQQTARQIVQVSGYKQQIINNKQLQYIKRINFNKLLSNKYDDNKIVEMAANIIQKMTRIDPNQRPQAKQILKQEIFYKLEDQK